jgi:outer membrane protein assembly factor BamB
MGARSSTIAALLPSLTACRREPVENGLGFFRTDSTLEAHDLTGRVLWSFAGDGKLGSTPIAAGGFVYIGSADGNLYALDESDGRQVWTDKLAAAVAPSNDTYAGSAPLQGLGVANELLVVPAGATLTAYGN